MGVEAVIIPHRSWKRGGGEKENEDGRGREKWKRKDREKGEEKRGREIERQILRL